MVTVPTMLQHYLLLYQRELEIQPELRLYLMELKAVQPLSAKKQREHQTLDAVNALTTETPKQLLMTACLPKEVLYEPVGLYCYIDPVDITDQVVKEGVVTMSTETYVRLLSMLVALDHQYDPQEWRTMITLQYSRDKSSHPPKCH